MKKHKAEELIKKKLEEFSGFQALENFDKQQSWKRMQFRLEKPAASHSRWWKIAAAALVIITTGYGVLYLRNAQTNHSTPEIPKTMVVNDLPRATMTDPRSSGDTIRKTQKSIMVKKITRKTEKKHVSLAKSGSSPKAPIPDIPVVIHDTLLQKENISQPVQATHSATASFQPKRPKQALRVVHINEIGNTGIPQTPVEKDESPGMFPIRLTNSVQASNPLLANRQIPTELIKINISSKN